MAVTLNKNFLYIMSNLIEKDWTSLTCIQQRQSVSALKSTLALIFDTDLPKFLPKVIVTSLPCSVVISDRS